MREFAFPRKLRLSDSIVIKNCFKKRSIFDSGLRLFWTENNLTHNRYLFTFKRNFATAVKRNNLRRICREVLRFLNHDLKQGYDLVFLFTDSSVEFSVKNNPIYSILTKARMGLDLIQ